MALAGLEQGSLELPESDTCVTTTAVYLGKKRMANQLADSAPVEKIWTLFG